MFGGEVDSRKKLWILAGYIDLHLWVLQVYICNFQGLCFFIHPGRLFFANWTSMSDFMWFSRKNRDDHSLEQGWYPQFMFRKTPESCGICSSNMLCFGVSILRKFHFKHFQDLPSWDIYFDQKKKTINLLFPKHIPRTHLDISTSFPPLPPLQKNRGCFPGFLPQLSTTKRPPGASQHLDGSESIHCRWKIGLLPGPSFLCVKF